jgi:hypothetical protein
VPPPGAAHRAPRALEHNIALKSFSAPRLRVKIFRNCRNNDRMGLSSTPRRAKSRHERIFQEADTHCLICRVGHAAAFLRRKKYFGFEAPKWLVG